VSGPQWHPELVEAPQKADNPILLLKNKRKFMVRLGDGIETKSRGGGQQIFLATISPHIGQTAHHQSHQLKNSDFGQNAHTAGVAQKAKTTVYIQVLRSCLI
jgi:hypothetical protein